MYKTEYCGNLDANYKFNLAPSGLKEISEKEYAQSMFFSYTPEFMSYKQILEFPVDCDASTVSKWEARIKKSGCLQMHLFHFHDGTGIGLSADFWAGKISYFRFGCKHSYRELSVEECLDRKIFHGGACYHVSECSLCKYVNAVDSSG
jgi:hypothetical protein